MPRYPSLFQIKTRICLNHLSRHGSKIVDPGLYIDHAPWQYNVFELRAI